MKTLIERDGSVKLGPELQARLGVGPGDELVWEERGTNDWVVKKEQIDAGLHYTKEGILVYRDEAKIDILSEIEKMRDDRMSEVVNGIRE